MKETVRKPKPASLPAAKAPKAALAGSSKTVARQAVKVVNPAAHLCRIEGK
jgi:hypothetical protein